MSAQFRPASKTEPGLGWQLGVTLRAGQSKPGSAVKTEPGARGTFCATLGTEHVHPPTWSTLKAFRDGWTTLLPVLDCRSPRFAGSSAGPGRRERRTCRPPLGLLLVRIVMVPDWAVDPAEPSPARTDAATNQPWTRRRLVASIGRGDPISRAWKRSGRFSSPPGDRLGQQWGCDGETPHSTLP
jgi:hypothetical protein